MIYTRKPNNFWLHWTLKIVSLNAITQNQSSHRNRASSRGRGDKGPLSPLLGSLPSFLQQSMRMWESQREQNLSLRLSQDRSCCATGNFFSAHVEGREPEPSCLHHSTGFYIRPGKSCTPSIVEVSIMKAIGSACLQEGNSRLVLSLQLAMLAKPRHVSRAVDRGEASQAGSCPWL